MTYVEPLTARSKGSDNANSMVVVALVASAFLLWWLATSHPSELPFWAPWEFSWAQFLTVWLTVWWYVRGLSLTTPAARPSIARQISFLAGVLVLLSQKVATNNEENHLFGKIHTSAMGGWNGSAKIE